MRIPGLPALAALCWCLLCACPTARADDPDSLDALDARLSRELQLQIEAHVERRIEEQIVLPSLPAARLPGPAAGATNEPATPSRPVPPPH